MFNDLNISVTFTRLRVEKKNRSRYRFSYENEQNDANDALLHVAKTIIQQSKLRLRQVAYESLETLSRQSYLLEFIDEDQERHEDCFNIFQSATILLYMTVTKNCMLLLITHYFDSHLN